jgi:hypothetical protein
MRPHMQEPWGSWFHFVPGMYCLIMGWCPWDELDTLELNANAVALQRSLAEGTNSNSTVTIKQGL